MILYHFTSEKHLEKILQEGLTRGDVPTSETLGLNGVWFTTSPMPDGHGVFGGEIVCEEARLAFMRSTGKAMPPGTRYADKKAVRITTMIASTDRQLVSWSKWGRKHCEPSFFRRLNESGPSFKTWLIYFGTIAPSQFTSVEVHGKRLDLEDAKAIAG